MVPFRVTESDLDKFKSLTSDDLGMWAVPEDGEIIAVVESKSEANSMLRDGPEPMDMGISWGAHLQCGDGDDDGVGDETDYYGGAVNYDNTTGEGEWSDRRVNRDW